MSDDITLESVKNHGLGQNFSKKKEEVTEDNEENEDNEKKEDNEEKEDNEDKVEKEAKVPGQLNQL